MFALALALAIAAPSPPPRPPRPSDLPPPTDLATLALGLDREAALIRQGKYAEAVRLLRACPEKSDLRKAPFAHQEPGLPRRYYTFHDATRRLLIVRCLLALGKTGEARRELRALYESTARPAYRLRDAHVLLVELETTTATDHAAFERWLDRVRPTTPADYAGSVRELADLKKDILAGRLDAAALVLMELKAYNGYLAPRRLDTRFAFVEACLRRRPGAAADLLKRVAARLEGGEDCGSLGWIHAAGEAGDESVIPALRQLRSRFKNYSVRLELLFALARVGDRAVIPDLLAARGGNLEHMRFIDALLRWLTGTRQGDLASAEDARVVFARWQAWLKKNPVAGRAP